MRVRRCGATKRRNVGKCEGRGYVIQVQVHRFVDNISYSHSSLCYVTPLHHRPHVM